MDPGGGASRWALSSRRKAERDYGRWLAWLEQHGLLDAAQPPQERATRSRVKQYLAACQATLSPFGVQSLLQGLGDVLRVMSETQEFGWIGRGAARLRSRAVSIKNKRQKLRPADELVDLGMRLMAEAEVLHLTDPQAAALLYRNGLVVAFLAYRPIRVGNLAAINLNKHLVQRGDGWWLLFGDDETKQRRVVEFSFPIRLQPALEQYLARYRPILVAGGAHRGSAGAALWVSQDGGPSTGGGLAQAIQKVTKEAFGKALGPHLFRDCDATMIAVEYPELVDIIPGVLGHSSMATSERHYIQASSIEAGRKLHAALGAKRKAAKRKCGKNSSGVGLQ